MESMTELDLEMIPEVQLILDEFGKTATLCTSNDTFDSQGTIAQQPNSQQVKIVPPDPLYLEFLPGTTMQHGRSATFVAAQKLTLAIKIGMTLKIDNTTFTVIAFNPVYSGESICMYALGLEA